MKFSKYKLSNATIEVNDDKSIIINVDRLTDWIAGYQNSYMESLAVAMKTIGNKISYEFLMGISGAAFRLQIGRFPEWCGMPTDSGRGFDCISSAWRSLGYSYYRVDSGEFMGEGPKKNKKAIINSIESGCPVIAMDLEDDMCWGLIVGYSRRGDHLFCRTKVNRHEEYTTPKKWPWLVDVVNRKDEDTDSSKLLLYSLRLAAILAHKQFEDFSCGFNGYEDWRKGLLNDKVIQNLNDQQMKNLCEGNAIYYSHLLDARSAAAKYLFSILDMFSERQRRYISSSAKIYQEIFERLSKGKINAQYPWQLKNKKWTQNMRYAQAHILEECLLLEKEAISKIESVIRLI